MVTNFEMSDVKVFSMIICYLLHINVNDVVNYGQKINAKGNTQYDFV